MRKYLTLDKENQRRLTLKFPDILRLESLSDEHDYKEASISVFDHWLSDDEAENLLVNVKPEEDLIRKSLHYNFNKKIVTSPFFDVVTYRMKGRNNNKRPVFKKFVNSMSARAYIVPSDYNIAEKFNFRLVMPAINCLYFEGSDYTNHLYYKGESDVEAIFSLAERCGLFVLK